jgi:dienelactone hydrolase
MMTRPGLLLTLLTLTIADPGQAMTPVERRDYLEKLQQILPEVPDWTKWQQRTGELPPDFDTLPKCNNLPDPLRFLDGRPVATPADWVVRRSEIRQLFARYVTGTFPPKPRLDRVVMLDETRGEGCLTRNVRLEFGPQGRGTLRVRVTIPDGPGSRPVLVSPNLAGWAPALLRRGYIAAGYAGNDFMDDTAPLAELYPEYDFATLPRRAWAAQLVVDYLETLPQVDRGRIAITGYSRDGKMATMAAALDERIAAIIAGSTGVGGVLAWRHGSERNQGESIESTTKMFPAWFHPRLRYFAGREDRLPVDANLLVALIAPRACLIEYGLNDEVSNPWGSEQTLRAVLPVYRLLGQPDNRLGLLCVPGFHGANDTEACLDWLDYQFGRSTRPWFNRYLFPWDFDAWSQRTQESVDLAHFPVQTAGDLPAAFARTAGPATDWSVPAAAVRQSVAWLLGDGPSAVPPTIGGAPVFPGFGPRGPQPGPTAAPRANPGQLAPDVPAWVISRGGPEFGWLEPEKNHTESRRIRFGYNVTGDLFYPAGTPEGTKLPAVVWLHGDSYPLGYMWVYRRDLHPILALVRAGYAVLAFDQGGFGSRMDEAAPFYYRYPHWSQFGRLVEDARAAVGALAAEPMVDANRIWLFGYTLGGAVAVHTAALDARVRGVVSICGWTPLRTDTAACGTGGVARFSLERGLLPRLGFFVGHEAQLPYDYDDLLATIAPRPVLVVQPQLDRGATPVDVHAAVTRADRVYAARGAAGRLGLLEPWDYARFPTVTQDEVIRWMTAQLPPPPVATAKERMP